MLTCRECQATKEDEHFQLRAGRRTRLCYSCVSVYRRNAYRDNAAVRVRVRAANRRSRLKQMFGLTEAEAATLLAGGCAICGTADDLCIDHDHESGRVRAALCGACNRAIGLLRDNPGLLRKAAAYIENHNQAAEKEPVINKRVEV